MSTSSFDGFCTLGRTIGSEKTDISRARFGITGHHLSQNKTQGFTLNSALSVSTTNICLLLELHRKQKEHKQNTGLQIKRTTKTTRRRNAPAHDNASKTIGINQTHTHQWKRNKIKREQHSICAWDNTLITHPEVLRHIFRALRAQ